MRRWPERSSSDEIHLPVMADIIVNQLNSCPDGVFIDSTVGGGGHLKAVFQAHGNRFRYFGFDLDQIIIEQTRRSLNGLGIEAELVYSNFSNVAGFLQGRGIPIISAILFDLGIGSFQIDDPLRGFSYLKNGPLSLAYDPKNSRKASNILKNYSEKELTELFRTYGEEPRAKFLARSIKNHKQRITTTGQLAEIIRSVVKDRYFVKTAARVFQALRIKVNEELDHISRGLESVMPLLAPGGKIMVISYHSLEDGIVKRIFKKYSGRCVCRSKRPACTCGKVKLVRPIFPKPVQPGPEEIALNPRARSAKLRIVERIAITS